MRTPIFTMKEARKFLRKPGTAFAMQAMADGRFIMAQKSDFAGQYDGYFCDYDGNAENCFVEGHILYLPSGVGSCADKPRDFDQNVECVTKIYMEDAA